MRSLFARVTYVAADVVCVAAVAAVAARGAAGFGRFLGVSSYHLCRVYWPFFDLFLRYGINRIAMKTLRRAVRYLIRHLSQVRSEGEIQKSS